MFNDNHHYYEKYDSNKYDFYSILFKYYKQLYPKLTELSKIHLLLNYNYFNQKDKDFYKSIPIFGKTDRNSIFVKNFYSLFDTNYNFLNNYINFINEYIKPLFPHEKYICVQKTPNIRFHVPNNSNIGKLETDVGNFIGIHNDAQFNHPYGEINIIIPITNMYNTNSIYYENIPNSNQPYSNYNSLDLNQGDFYIGNLNLCKHYNMINNTPDTRISLDFRILPYKKYVHYNKKVSTTFNTKFTIGNYYMLL